MSAVRGATTSEVANRWDRVGRIAAYGAALALTPYVVIKASWVIGSLVGALPVGAGFSTASWVVLNTITIGMATAGIVVALSLVRPWGSRLPGRPLALCAWVAVGFLVPLLPFAVLSSLLQPDAHPGEQQHDPAAMPGWEAALIQIGFIGMGLGLALGLPAYLRRRWPGMFTVRLDGTGRQLRRQRVAALIAAAVGVFWLAWTAGSTLGVAHPATVDASWRVLNGISGAWALIMAFSIHALQRRKPLRTPRWIPATGAWIGSGTLFAWSGWKLAITCYLIIVRPAVVALPENLDVAAVLHTLAVLAAAIVAPALARASVTPTTPAAPATPIRQRASSVADTERDMIAK